jgi:hypothetical protein
MAEMANNVFTGFKTSDKKPYTNAYNAEAITKVRLVHNAGNCTAALLLTDYTPVDNSGNSVLPALSYTVPPDTKFVTINGCANPKGEIPLNGATAAPARNGVLVIDYSHGKDGLSLLDDQQRANLETQLAAINKPLELSGKLYILNQDNPNYTQLKQQAQADVTPGTRIIELSKAADGSLQIKMDYSFTPPQWMAAAFPSPSGYSCSDEYIAEGLSTLHESIFYKSAPIDHRILAEYGTVVYRGIFGLFYCATGEEAVKNSSSAAKFIAGALHEMIATVDVAALMGGIIDMAKGSATGKLNSYTSFISDVKQTFDDYKNNKPIDAKDLVKRLMPPGVRSDVKAIQTAYTVGNGFVKFYFTDCGEMCPYRYGQVTVMIVPIVLTVGDWVVVKGAALAARMKTLTGFGKTLQRTDEVAKLLVKSEQAGNVIVSDGARIVVKESEDVAEVVATVEKSGEEVIIKEGEDVAKASKFASFKNISKLPDNVLAKLEGEGWKDLLGKLDDDLADDALRAAFAEKEELVESWKALDNIGVDDVIRKNHDYLKNIDDYAKRFGKNADEVADLAKNNENGIEQFLDELGASSSGVWSQNPFRRGQDIEQALGQNLPSNFPVIDKFENGLATSIKSIDLNAKTYQDATKLEYRLKNYVDKAAGFNGQTWAEVVIKSSDVKIRALDLAIPFNGSSAQQGILNQIMNYGTSKGVTVNIIIYP